MNNSYKFILNLIFTLILVFVCSTGCAKVSYLFDIGSDDNVSITVVSSNSTEMFDGSTMSFSEFKATNDKMKQNLKEVKQGYDITYTDTKDGYYNCIFSKQIMISELNKDTLPSAFSTILPEPILVKSEKFKDVYEINLVYDPKVERLDSVDTASKEELLQNSLIALVNASLSEMPVEITIKIPTKALSHNATSVVSDTEYKWTTVYSKPITIAIKYEKENKEAIENHRKKVRYTCVGLGVVLLFLIVLILRKIFIH